MSPLTATSGFSLTIHIPNSNTTPEPSLPVNKSSPLSPYP